ncbi:hypothetical protein P2318_07840 [Myxococcaceae bacterium GXIMD 01537]
MPISTSYNSFHGLLVCAVLAASPVPAKDEPAGPPPDTAVSARFSGQTLELREQDGSCTLHRPGKAPLVLQVKWPCQFHRDDAGRLRVKSREGAPILLVERSERMPNSDRDCLTEVQAVRLRAGELEGSPAVNRVSSCLPFRWDEKVFVGMF